MSEAGFAAASGGGQTASVRFGVHNDHLPVVGKSVKEVRGLISGRWPGSADAQAFIGKTQLADDYIIKEGDQLDFQRKTGEKG